MKQLHYTFQFVEYMPKALDEGVLYVSMTYATASHQCFCGCGMKVVTPLSPTDWRLTFNGDTVSLDPSVGNWSYPCRSHYILRGNRVVWAGPMSAGQIRVVRESDARDKARYYGQRVGRMATAASEPLVPDVPASAPRPEHEVQRSIWRRLLDFF
ncbi:MAG: hypothetical protein IPP44_08910 [Ideonella sp.]|nr:hypothetical protein [Ideonella sp.]